MTETHMPTNPRTSTHTHRSTARRWSLTALLLALVMSACFATAQDGSAGEEVAELNRQIDALQQQVTALQGVVVSSNLLLADRYLVAAGFHAMDEALHDGELDPRYLETVRRTIAAVSALHWPDTLRGSRDAFLEAATELEAALAEQDVDAAASAAERVHAREHDLTHAIFEFLGAERTAHAAQPEQAAHGHPEEAPGARTEAAGAAVPEGAEAFVLAIAQNGGPVGGALTHRVRRGDTVALVLRTQIDGELHLHGYDLDWHLHQGEEIVATFPAESAGRFPVEFHPDGADRGVVVAYLEVHP